MNNIEHDKTGRVITRNLNKDLVTCEHGITGKCWWCEQLENKSGDEKFNIMEQRFKALLSLISKVIIPTVIRAQGKGGIGGVTEVKTETIRETIGKQLISQGLDIDKPTGNHGLSFYQATDTDTIYQARDNKWIDISFSKPDIGEKAVTDISVKEDKLQIKYED